MVHGGGHHSISSGSGSSGGGWGGGNRGWNNNRGFGWGGGGWGRTRHYDHNVVIINNERGLRSYQNYRGPMHVSPTSDGSSCRQCCLCCACFAGCGAATAAAARNSSSLTWLIFISFTLLVVLVAVSQVNENWTFNPGETRHVPVKRLLNSQIDIASQIPNRIHVYDLKGRCPKLTGPTVPLEETWNITLSRGDYQFDYFYLNQGSVIKIYFQQWTGATNIDVFTGKNALHALQHEEQDQDFTSPVLTRYAGTSQQVTMRYTVPSSDIYTLVYDNASNAASSSATVSYHIDMATYKLKKKSPMMCSPLTCTVELSRKKSCILLQAIDVVTVHITAQRRWHVILLVALLPLVIGVVVLHLKSAQEDDPIPSATQAQKLPTVHESHDDDDYESLPILAVENVEPIAVPVDTTM